MTSRSDMTSPTLSAETIAKLRKLEARATPGEWHCGHFADDNHPCGCTGIISEWHAGAICHIDINNGKAIGDGGNDAPPLNEAKANGLLVAAARNALPALLATAEVVNDLMEALEFAANRLSGAAKCFRANKLNGLAGNVELDAGEVRDILACARQRMEVKS